MDLVIGCKYRLFFQEGNPNNSILEIRAIVDGNIVVYKTWSDRKSRYIYNIGNKDLFEIYYANNFIKPLDK